MKAFLWPAEQLYRGALMLRHGLYRTGVLPVRRAGVPVVCVGNLSMGGTGKTPMVEHVTRTLQARGRRPAVVSRGYKRSTPQGQLLWVSDGEHVLQSASAGGDEPVLLAHGLRGVPVVVCADRARACAELVASGRCDCIVLDDGFQHWRLARNADFVLVDAALELSRMRLLPAGTLREPLTAVRRATAVLHTKVAALDPREDLATFHRANAEVVRRLAPDVPQFAVQFVEGSLLPLREGMGGELDAQALHGAKVLAFSGIANPESFFASVRRLGCEVVPKAYPDHHAYGPSDLAGLAAEAVSGGCEALLTTGKDAVKLGDSIGEAAVPVFVLAQRAIIDRPEQFTSLLMKATDVGGG